MKLEKLDIMIRLAGPGNIGNVLAELKEWVCLAYPQSIHQCLLIYSRMWLPSSLTCRYATEVDVDFVRKSVRAIGRCAIKVESAAERCVSTLVELIQTKVTYVVQEAVVVIKVKEGTHTLMLSSCVIFLSSLPPGHLPQVSQPVWEHHLYSVWKPGLTGWARGQVDPLSTISSPECIPVLLHLNRSHS